MDKINKFLNRILVLLFVNSVFILLLYFVGSYQYYLDDSLLGLITIYKYSSLLFISLAVSTLIIISVTDVKRAGKHKLKQILIIILGILFSLFFYIAVETIATFWQNT